MAALGDGRDLVDVVRAPEPAALNHFAALIGREHRADPAPTRTLFDDDDNFLAGASDAPQPILVQFF